MSFIEIQKLKDENAQLKRGLKRAVSMIQTLLEYREFVLFSCKCDCREKILLKGDNRYEMLIKECDFLQRETQREAVSTKRRHEERSRREEVTKRSRQEEKNRREVVTSERSKHEEKNRKEVSPKRNKQEEKETKEPVPSTSTPEILSQPSDSKPDQSTSSTSTLSKNGIRKRRKRDAQRKKLALEAEQKEQEALTSAEIPEQPADSTPVNKEAIKKRKRRKAYRLKRGLEAEQARLEGKPLPERYVNYLRKSAEHNKKVAEESFKQSVELVKQANTSSSDTSADHSEEAKKLIQKAKIKAHYALRQLETIGECPPVQSPEDLLYREVVPP